MAKKNSNPEADALELLQSVLPKAVTDAKLVEKIFSACKKEIESKNRAQAFEKFCKRAELPDLKKESISTIQKQFEETFGKGKVNIVSMPQKEAAVVEVILPEETFEGVIKVGAKSPDEGEGSEDEFKPKFVPFPISLDTDPELVWTLGRGETMTPDEASIALQKVQDDFWASKAGQKLISKERVDRSFPEFISRVPSKLLGEVGLKRHYKEAEPLKTLRPITSKPAKSGI